MLTGVDQTTHCLPRSPDIPVCARVPPRGERSFCCLQTASFQETYLFSHVCIAQCKGDQVFVTSLLALVEIQPVLCMWRTLAFKHLKSDPQPSVCAPDLHFLVGMFYVSYSLSPERELRDSRINHACRLP